MARNAQTCECETTGKSKGKCEGTSKGSDEGEDAGKARVEDKKGGGKGKKPGKPGKRPGKPGQEGPKIRVSYSHESSRCQFLARATGESSVQFKYKASKKDAMAKAEAACKAWCRAKCKELKVAASSKFL